MEDNSKQTIELSLERLNNFARAHDDILRNIGKLVQRIQALESRIEALELKVK